MRKRLRIVIPTVAALTVFEFAVPTSSASTGGTGFKHFGTTSSLSSPFISANGIGPLPPATTSAALTSGGADVSDGTTPAPGGIIAGFMKGGESYNGSSTTTVINFDLPPGVTVDTSCGGPCIEGGDDCSPEGGPVVAVSGNEIKFRLACAPGQGLGFEALLTSLITTPGTYNTTVQFKVGVFNRAKGGNMWQINPAGPFFVGT
jgi:hypothetical protein